MSRVGHTLSDGWASTTLGELCLKPQYGWTTKATGNEGKAKLLRTTDLSRGRVEWETVPYCSDEPKELVKYLLEESDIVISRAGSVGLSALIGPCPEAVFASYLIRFRRVDGVDERYLYQFLQSPEYWEQVSQQTVGIALQNVNAKKLAGVSLPLAPLPEQRRIVAEIEKQFTRLDASVTALKRVQTNLKRHRASILKAACEGRLVLTEADLARAEGRDYEPADRLLERILAERRARWEAQENRRGKYKEPVAPETSDLPGLPEGWVWATVGQSFDVYVGSTPRRAKLEYWNGDIAWVSSSEVAFSRIKCTREYITEEGLRNSSLYVHPEGTVLLGMIGEGKTRGQVSILDIPACNSQNSAAIRVSESGFPPEYVFYYLWSQYEATRQIGSGNNQPALNKSRVQEIAFPLPPLAEQRRIVAEVERRLSVIQQTEATVEANLTRAERLRQSILKQAFSGNLVPQDPNDEPASALLERIRVEREAAQAAAKNSRQTRPCRGKSPSARQLVLREGNP